MDARAYERFRKRRCRTCYRAWEAAHREQINAKQRRYNARKREERLAHPVV